VIGYDYTARIAPAALKAAGCSVVSRYVTRLDWPKSLQRAEADDLRAAGIPIMCNFETTADRMKGGAAAGRADAAEALQHMAVLGAPAGVTVWFSADWDVQPSEVPAVLAYLQAAAGVLGSKSRTGLYGGLRAVSAAADAGYPIWQTIAWSGGRWDSRALMRQIGTEQNVGGVQVDVNEVINLAALGAWGGPTTGGTDMVNNVIPASIAHHFPGLDLTSDFPANTPFDEAIADIWTDGRAEAAWRYGLMANQKLDQLLARPAAPAVDVDALAAALVPHLSGGVDPNAVAQAVVAHLGLEVVAK